MSPSVPVLFALLLALTSGSAEGGRWTTSPVALLRQTLRYWRKIYRTYHEEVALGYCWADYLLEISDELSANLSAPLAATGDRARSRRKASPFPGTAAAAASRRRESRRKRSHAPARFAISGHVRDRNGRRVAPRREMVGKRARWITNEVGRGIGANNAEGNNGTDGSKRITSAADTCAERRRLPGIVTRGVDRAEFARARDSPASRATGSWAVNPPPNPADQVGPGSPKVPEEEDTRRKVLRAATSQRAFGPRSFSLKLHRGRRSHDGRRFPSRRSSRERNSRVSGPLSEPLDRGAGDPREASRVPLRNNDGGWPPLSRLPFRRINAERRTAVVKLTNSAGNSSRAINSSSATARKCEELSRDSLLSLGVVAERSPLKSRRSAGEAVERKRSETGGGGDAREGKCSCDGRDVLPARIPPEERNGVPLSGFGRLRQQMPYENRGFSIVPRIPAAGQRAKRSTEDYEEGDHGSTARNVPLRPDPSGNQDRRSVLQPPSLVSNVRAFIIGVLRTLGMFVQVGRQIMDIVESNAVLACTKEYLWIKITRWIDT